MKPWYKVATPRKEVREGRSFSPDEFAIALEQVVDGTAPKDYSDPMQFFSRTCFTKALNEHVGLVLRRLAGQTQNTAPVLALITQFGGGKTHTLTALYHLIKNSAKSVKHEGVLSLLKTSKLKEIPKAKVAVFVGNAWDPAEGKETPWIDIARKLAGDKGVQALGRDAHTKAPGTENLRKLYEAAGGHVLILCDEVLNFLSRHRDMAEQFRDFMSNLVRSMTGTTGCAAMFSLPQSKPEMSDWDLRWQDIIIKEVGRVAKQLIANDEAEISEVVRRRLFEDLGSDRVWKSAAKVYADWCFERRAQLPTEWTRVDSASTEAKAREFLQSRFETCYPFHPSTLSVFQRKWQALPQYQQTRGTLAMFAQWISWVYREGYREARIEPLITIGSAPLHISEFRGMILGQLGEPKLIAAIDADIAGPQSHARGLDLDMKAPLQNLHRRVATAILFESSGGQVDKLAHLPELRFALGEPNIDTTSVDTAAFALESKAFFIRKVGSDGFQIRHVPTLRKVVSDRRASLDEETEIKPIMKKFVSEEFNKGRSLALIPFPEDSSSVNDSTKLTLTVMDPKNEWTGSKAQRKEISEWTKKRGESPRLYPASIIWCFKKQGSDLKDKIELYLAWKRVSREVADGTLGEDFDPAEKAEIGALVREAESAVKDEVWAGYRYVILLDNSEKDSIKEIDLGAGHASSGETLCGRIISALKSQSLLSESIGAGYIERNWPDAFRQSGAWPLISLRQSFLNGSLTRLLDPDMVLKQKICEFVERGDFGLTSGSGEGKKYERIWYEEIISGDEIRFESGLFLLKRSLAMKLKEGVKPEPEAHPEPEPEPKEPDKTEPEPTIEKKPQKIRLTGTIPPEIWNRLGTKIIPKLRSANDLTVGIEFSISVDSKSAKSLSKDLRLALDDLGLSDRIEIIEE